MTRADDLDAEQSMAQTGPGWRHTITALAIVFSPIALGVMVTIVGLAVYAIWLMAHGASFKLPAPASLGPYGLLSYAAGSWLAVALAWAWSGRQNLRPEVFAFRKLTLPAVAAAVAGFAIVAVGVPLITHWLTGVTGGQSQDVRVDPHDGFSVATAVFLFVVTTPISEEILYRGLLLAWLRRLGCKDAYVLMLGSLLFAANHVVPLGIVWATAMILLGVVTSALRLRFRSLSPGWLAHMLFNAQLTLAYPVMAWLA